MRLGDVVELDLEDLPNAQLAGPRPGGLDVTDLEHEHVAAVAAAPLDPPPGCGVLGDGRDNLEEGVAEREDGVAKAEMGDVRVGERLVEVELGSQAPGDGVEVPCRQDRLAKP